MKLVLGLTLLAILASAKAQTMQELHKACQKQEGASAEDSEAAKKFEVPETRSLKCFYACVLEKTGTSDGKQFVAEGLLKFGERVAGHDAKALADIKMTAAKCDGIENEDRCELAAEIIACFREEGKE